MTPKRLTEIEKAELLELIGSMSISHRELLRAHFLWENIEFDRYKKLEENKKHSKFDSRG